ncbi:MAG TPA: hypothetical protein VFE39_00285 [Pseudonocardia sp.]|nr:hypothetical protein [Pseudonocardia sp.]
MHAAINRARAELVRPAAEHQRDLAGDHLDALTARAWAVVDDPGPVVSAGKVVLDAEGRSIRDRRVLLEALKILVMIDERRARLVGLDAPRRQAVEVVTNEVVDAEIAELTQKLANREAARGRPGRDRERAAVVTGVRIELGQHQSLAGDGLLELPVLRR